MVKIPQTGGSITSQSNKTAKSLTLEQQKAETREELLKNPQAGGSVINQKKETAESSTSTTEGRHQRGIDQDC